MHASSFLQASYYSTPITSRVLIHPVCPNLPTPDGRSWSAVNDEVLQKVGSRTLLALVDMELTREMRKMALQHINGWVFHTKNALSVKEKLEQAACRFGRIRDGIFAQELTAAITELFDEDPRYQARLSGKDDTEEAVNEVIRRVVSQCSLTWELGLFSMTDARAFGIHLLIALHDMIYESCLERNPEELMMSPTRFARYERFYEFIEQFRGVDRRVDRAIADYKNILAAFPEDGSSLYSGGLKEFWRELTRLGGSIKEELERTFYEEPSLQNDYDEESLNWEIESESMLDDFVDWELSGIETGVDLGIGSSSESIDSDSFNVGLPSNDDFWLEPSPNS